METIIKVEGMSCGHCVSAVKGALEALQGVHAVTVQLDSGQVEVTYEDSLVKVADLHEAITEQGYDVKE